MEPEKCRATRLGKMDRYREVIVKPGVKIAHLRHRACRLLAGCFSLEISVGIMRRDYLDLFSQEENGMTHGPGTHEKKNRLQTLLLFLRTFTLVKII